MSSEKLNSLNSTNKCGNQFSLILLLHFPSPAMTSHHITVLWHYTVASTSAAHFCEAKRRREHPTPEWLGRISFARHPSPHSSPQTDSLLSGWAPVCLKSSFPLFPPFSCDLIWMDADTFCSSVFTQQLKFWSKGGREECKKVGEKDLFSRSCSCQSSGSWQS